MKKIITLVLFGILTLSSILIINELAFADLSGACDCVNHRDFIWICNQWCGRQNCSKYGWYPQGECYNGSCEVYGWIQCYTGQIKDAVVYQKCFADCPIWI
jgi:hypothetical protein